MRHHTKPILMGTLSYLPIYAVLWGMTQLPNFLLQSPLFQLLLVPYNLIMLPGCGYIAARISRQNGLFVGAITGLLIAIATAAVSATLFGKLWSGESLTSSTLILMLKYSFYSALGGGVGELHARRNSSA